MNKRGIAVNNALQGKIIGTRQGGVSKTFMGKHYPSTYFERKQQQ